MVYPISAQDISVEDAVNFDPRAIGQTQGAGVPNAIGAGAFIPLHKTSNAVTYVDIEAKANLDDRSGDSSIINTDVAGTTLSTSTRLSRLLRSSDPIIRASAVRSSEALPLVRRYAQLVEQLICNQ